MLALRDSLTTNNGSSKKRTKLQRRYNALVEAVLPLITDPILWELPIKSITIDTTDRTFSDHILDTPPDTAASRGNEILSACLVKFVVSMVSMVRVDVDHICALAIPPIVDKAFEPKPNFSMLSSVALQGLTDIAECRNMHGVPQLLSANFTRLFGELQKRSNRALASEITDIAQESVGVIARTVVGILRQILKANADTTLGPSEEDVESRIVYTIELLKSLTTQFDRQSRSRPRSTQTADRDFGDMLSTAFGLVDAYGSAVDLLSVSRGYDRNNNQVRAQRQSPKYKILEEDDEPWLELLRPFRKRESDVDLSGKEIARLFLKDQDENPNDEHPDQSNERQSGVTPNELSFLWTVSERCDYLLSSGSLFLQRRCWETKTSIVRYFGYLDSIVSVSKVRHDIFSQAILQ